MNVSTESVIAALVRQQEAYQADNEAFARLARARKEAVSATEAFLGNLQDKDFHDKVFAHGCLGFIIMGEGRARLVRVES